MHPARRGGVEPKPMRRGGVTKSEMRGIFERLPEAVLVADGERRFVEVNDAALALLGVARTDLIERRIDELVNPEALEALQANWDDLLARGSQDGEILLYLPGHRRLRVNYRGAAHAEPGRHVFVIRRAAAQGDFRRAQRLEEEARTHAARLRSLSEASRAFAEAGTALGPLLDAVARRVAAAFGSGAGVGLSTRPERGLVMRKLYHPDPEALAVLRAARVPANAGAAVDQVLQTGQSVMVAIPADGDIDAAGPPPIRSMMLAPLRAPHRIAGAVWVSRDRADHPFTPRDLAMLEDLAERATLAIETARALRRARRAKERTVRLQAVTAAVTEPLTVTAVAEVVLREARESLGAATGVVYRLDEVAQDLELVAVTGSLAKCRDRMSRIPLDGAFAVPHAVREGRPILLSSREERNRLYGAASTGGVESGAVAAVPLLVHGRAVGGLGLAFAEERVWKNEDVVFLTAIARHAAQAFERARLFELANTARREAEQAVTVKDQSLALLNTLFASAPVGLAFLDRDLQFLRINEVLAAMNGRSPADHIGRTLRDVLPLLADEIEPKLRGVFATSKPIAGHEVRGETPAAPGESHTFLASYYPVRPEQDPTSGVVGVGVVVTDVTAQKRSSEMMSLLAGAGAILSAQLDYDRALNDLAQLVVPSLGDWCAVEVIERGEARLVAVAHSDPAKVEIAREVRRRYPPLPRDPTSVFEVARHRRSQLIAEIDDARLAARARDDEHLRLSRILAPRSAIVVPLVAGGRGFGMLTLVASESGRRYGPADLAIVEELAHRAALAVENARLFADARDAVRVREEFLSIAGHELKTPLTALKLQLEGLSRLAQRSGDVDRKAVLSRLEGTLRQSERLEKLVNQLLDVSRIAAGRLTLDREEVDLASVARDVWMRFAEEAARSGSTLALDAGGPLLGWWDRLRLDQVVTNLVSNAVKYGRGLPIEMCARADGGDTVLLEVRDHGIGIPPENQARIFGRFERAVPERHYGGFGLGLWIARQLIDAHGGSIAVESAPGQGSRFTVRLPRNDRRAHARHAAGA
jgi:signal transduction histidine kinase/PAS domain-containing protein